MFALNGPSRLTTATVVVTMTTGMIEAVSFVGLGYVFTAMMTGNLLFIGFAAVAAIVLGAFLGTLVLRLNPTAALLAIAAVQFGTAALLRGVEITS